MEIRRMASEEAKKLKFPEMSEEELRAFIKRNNDLEGQYLDDEEREIMEAYNGGPELPPTLTEEEIDFLVKNGLGRPEDSKRT